MSQFNNIQQALYRQEDSQDLYDFSTKQKLNRFKFISDEFSFDIDIKQISLRLYEETQLSKERVYLFQVLVDDFILKSGSRIELDIKILGSNWNHAMMIDQRLQFNKAQYDDLNFRVHQKDVVLLEKSGKNDREKMKKLNQGLADITVKGSFHPEKIVLKIPKFSVDVQYQDINFLEKFISNDLDLVPNCNSLVEELIKFGHIGKIKNCLNQDYEISPNKFKQGIANLNDDKIKKFETRDYLNRLKVQKMSSCDFAVSSYPWLGQIFEEILMKNIDFSNENFNIEIELERGIILHICLVNDTNNEKTSDFYGLNLILMPKNVFLNFTGADICFEKIKSSKDKNEGIIKQDKTIIQTRDIQKN